MKALRPRPSLQKLNKGYRFFWHEQNKHSFSFVSNQFHLPMNYSIALTFVPSCAVPRTTRRRFDQANVAITRRQPISAVSAPPPPARHVFDNKKMPFDHMDASDEHKKVPTVIPKNIETQSQLDVAITSTQHKLTVLKVYSRSCRSCQRVERPFIKLCQQYHRDVLCVQLVAECNQELAQSLGVRGFPTFIFYRNGKRVDHFASSSGDTVEETIIDNL